MSVRTPQQQTRPGAGARLRRLAAATAAVITVVIASAVTVPAAWAVTLIPNDGPAGQAPAQAAATAGGMPGWQITLIAVAAALAAATAAVLADRARAARRAAPATTA